MPSAQLSCFDTTTGWWAECLGVGLVVGRRLIEGGAVPCLSPVVTDFPEISRKFEGLRLELVSRNFALVQQKSGPGPRGRTATPIHPLSTRRQSLCSVAARWLFALLPGALVIPCWATWFWVGRLIASAFTRSSLLAYWLSRQVSLVFCAAGRAAVRAFSSALVAADPHEALPASHVRLAS